MIKIAIIKKLPGTNKYRLYSRKKDSTGHRRNLGTFNSYDAAMKHEKQVHFFKGQGADDQNAHDKSTKALKSISDVAHYLEQAGYVKHADELYAAMDSFGEFDDAAVDGIPDNQLNVENQGSLSNTGPSQGTFNSPEAEKIASLANHFDKLGLYKEADILDEILKKAMNFGKTINFSQDGDHKPQIQVNYFTNKDDNQVSKNKNFDNLSEALDFFEHLEPETEMDSEDHPPELYHNPSFIRWLQKNPNIIQMLKERYRGLYLGMIDAMDAYFNPRSEKLLGQNWENDPVKFLKWYVGSKEEKEDLEWNPEKEISNENEANNMDALVNWNGLQETTPLNNGSEFGGLSDSYFYQDYTNLDHRYKISP